MAWLYMPSVGIANGGTVVSVTGGVDLSQIKAGWLFSIGTTIAEVKSGTAPDGSGNSNITLERAWEGVTAVAQSGLVVPTSGALVAALEGLKETNDYAIEVHKKLSDVATLDADITITDSAGTEHTFASMLKNTRLISEAITLMGQQADQKVDSLVSDINNQLDNPLAVSFYLSSSGLDTNTGVSSSNALLTVKEAMDRTPTGGLCKLIIAAGEVYLLTERTLIADCDVELTLNAGAVFEQSLTSGGAVAGLALGKRQSFYATGGYTGILRTINDASAPSMDKALFYRQDMGKVDLRIFGCKVELGDQHLAWGGQTANGQHEFNVGHSTIELRAGRVQNSQLFGVTNGCLSLSIASLTNNTGIDFVDLIGGIIRVNGLPINLITNSSTVYAG